MTLGEGACTPTASQKVVDKLGGGGNVARTCLAVADINPSPLEVATIMRRSGVSLIEVLVVLGLIALLLALTLPAVQSARMSARRMTCQNHLRQLALGVAEYEATHGTLPGNGCIVACNSWLCAILPFVELPGLATRANLPMSPIFPDNPYQMDEARRPVPLFRCPSDVTTIPAEALWPTSYCGNEGTGLLSDGYNGLFRPCRPYSRNREELIGPVRLAEVTDGLSNTALATEWLTGLEPRTRNRVVWRLDKSYSSVPEMAEACQSLPADPAQLGWESTFRGQTWTCFGISNTLYNHALPPNRPSCSNNGAIFQGVITAASQHPGGVNVAYADGRVVFVSHDIDAQVWRAQGSRSEPLLSE